MTATRVDVESTGKVSMQIKPQTSLGARNGDYKSQKPDGSCKSSGLSGKTAVRVINKSEAVFLTKLEDRQRSQRLHKAGMMGLLQGTSASVPLADAKLSRHVSVSLRARGRIMNR